MWAAWVLLLWWTDYCGWSGGLGWPRSGWPLGPALYGGCSPLVGEAGSQGGWLQKPGDLGLPLAHQWVRSGFRKSRDWCLPASG